MTKAFAILKFFKKRFAGRVREGLVFRLALVQVISFLLLSSSNSEAQRSYFFGHTTDATPVNISLRDKDAVLDFKIPKAYLTFSENWSGGLQDFLVLEASFPSMTPLSFAGGDVNKPDALVIHLHSYSRTGAKFSTRGTIDFFASQVWTYVGDTQDKIGRSYRHYLAKRDLEKPRDDDRFGKEYFVADDRDAYLECFLEAQNPNMGCSLFADYAKSLSLTIQFRRSQFEHWPEFYQSVVTLFDSLRPG
jgi:hypothetical protein